MSTLSPENRRGIAAMCFAMACFVTNDAMVKFVSQSLPASELIFVRGVFASLLVLAAVHAMGATRQLPRLLNRRVLARATLDAVATMTYLTSLFHLPIANATAINMSAPLFITLMAVVVLREKVGAGRWLAIAAGFFGVMLIVQPTSDGFNAFALLCVGGTMLHATRDFLTRFIAQDIPSIVITMSTVLSVALLAGVLCLFQGWVPMAWWQLGMLAAASAFLAGGYYLLIGSMRSGEISVIAPFRYVGLLFALVLGYVAWGDVPNVLALAGIAVLVASGLFILNSETRKRAVLDAATD